MVKPLQSLPLRIQGKKPCLGFYAFPLPGLYQHPSGPLMGSLDSAIPVAAGKQYPDGNDAVYRPFLHNY